MKKFLMIVMLLMATSAFALYTGGWNYVLHSSGCMKVTEEITAGKFINSGCTISNYEREGTLMVLNCNDVPEIGGYVWFGRTLKACKVAEAQVTFD